MMFGIEKGAELTRLLDIIESLHEECNFVFGTNNVILQQTDLAKVSMVKITVDKKFFKSYKNSETLNRRYDINTISKFVGRINAAISATEMDNSLTIEIKSGYSRKIKVFSLEGFEELPAIPEWEPDVVFECPISALKDAIEDCTIVSEDFLLESDENGLIISGKSPHLGEASVNFEWGQLFKPKKTSKTAQAYNALLFLDFIKSLESGGFESVEIMFGRERPLKLKAEKENVLIEYALGHMIMEEEESEESATEILEESS